MRLLPLLTCYFLFQPFMAFADVSSDPSLELLSSAFGTKDKPKLCELAKDHARFLDLPLDSSQRISEKNPPGFFKTGLCLWYSRFQRNAFYLTYFSPTLAKPDPESAKKIIHAIRMGNQVVEIPGYSGLSSFISDWIDQLNSELSDWEFDDTLSFGWLKNLGLKNSSAEQLQKNMDGIYQAVSEGKIPFAMIKWER